MYKSAYKSKVFARSLSSPSIFAQVFSAGNDIFSNMNRTKQRASLRVAHATAAQSQIIGSLKLVIKSTFSSCDLFLLSESYSPIVSLVIHQANLRCSSNLMYGIAIRVCIFGVARISFSKSPSTTALLSYSWLILILP